MPPYLKKEAPIGGPGTSIRSVPILMEEGINTHLIVFNNCRATPSEVWFVPLSSLFSPPWFSSTTDSTPERSGGSWSRRGGQGGLTTGLWKMTGSTKSRTKSRIHWYKLDKLLKKKELNTSWGSAVPSSGQLMLAVL